jgi:thymidine phosphorylase
MTCFRVSITATLCQAEEVGKASEPLFKVHAEAKGALDYAMEYAAANPDILKIEE